MRGERWQRWPRSWERGCGGIASGAFGDVLELRFGPGGRAKKQDAPLMLLGHLDTVWPLGTLAKMPFRIADGRAWGPGTLDMKAGMAMAMTALDILRTIGVEHRPIVMLLNSDEEVGSPVSRPITEKLARECAAVFVLEPAQGMGGAYKTARKGVGDYTVRVKGVAAHAGVDFAAGTQRHRRAGASAGDDSDLY